MHLKSTCFTTNLSPSRSTGAEQHPNSPLQTKRKANFEFHQAASPLLAMDPATPTASTRIVLAMDIPEISNPITTTTSQDSQPTASNLLASSTASQPPSHASATATATSDPTTTSATGKRTARYPFSPACDYTGGVGLENGFHKLAHSRQ